MRPENTLKHQFLATEEPLDKQAVIDYVFSEVIA